TLPFLPVAIAQQLCQLVLYAPQELVLVLHSLKQLQDDLLQKIHFRRQIVRIDFHRPTVFAPVPAAPVPPPGPPIRRSVPEIVCNLQASPASPPGARRARSECGSCPAR